MTYFKLKQNKSLPSWVLANGAKYQETNTKKKKKRRLRKAIEWGRNHGISRSVQKYGKFCGKYL